MNKKFNIPNSITTLRILSVPVLIYFAITGDDQGFFVLWIVSVSTDAFDGFLARMLKQKTDFGARLDSIADFLMYIVTLFGIYMLKWEEFGPYKTLALVILFYFLFTDLFSLLKFGKISSLHLYSWKIGGLLQTAFVFWLFYRGFDTFFFKIVFVWTSLAFVENILIQMMMKTYRSNMKHFFYFLKTRDSVKK